MAINTQTIRIDLNTGRTIPVAFAHQNDTNRQLTFQLYNNGVAFTPSSTTVKFAYKSPIVNGRYSVITGSQMASGTVSGNTVTVTLPAQYTQVSGVGLLTMILTTSGNTLRPVNIKFVCQGSADGDDTILAASDWPEGLYDYMDNWLEENEPTEIANLKSEIMHRADGYETFALYAAFANGGLSNGVFKPNDKFRVATDTLITASRDLNVTILYDYRIAVHFFVNGVFDSQSGWQYLNYTIPAGSTFKLAIAKRHEDTSVVANVDEFVSAVTFPTKSQSGVNRLNEWANSYEPIIEINKTAIKVANNSGVQYFDLWAEFVNGTLDSGVLNTNNKHRVCTNDMLLFDSGINISIDSNYRVIFSFYDSSNTYTGASGYVYNSYYIPANQRFKITIAKRYGEDTSVVADVDTFVSKITFATYAEDALTLSNRVNQMSGLGYYGTYPSGLTNYVIGYKLKTDGTLAEDARYCVSEFISVPTSRRHTTMRFWCGSTSANVEDIYCVAYDSSKSVLGYYGNNKAESANTDTLPNGIAYIRFTFVYGYPAKLTYPLDVASYTFWFAKNIAPVSLGAINSYYFDNNYLPDKVTDILGYIRSGIANGDAFIFITDVHWERNAQQSPQIIRYIKARTGINKCFFGGDGYDGYGLEPMNSLRDCMGTGKVYPVVGNHEFLSPVNFASDTYATVNDAFASEFMQIDDSVVWGEPGHFYYYKDNNIKKIRYIFLQAYSEHTSGGADGATVGYDADQIAWLQNIALNVDVGWTIVIVTHCLVIGDKTTREIRDNQPESFEAVVDVLNDYNGNGIIAGVLQGHFHWDWSYVLSSGIPVITTTCDKYVMSNEPNGVNRAVDTIEEQAFDVVVLDTSNKKWTLVRIGAKAELNDLSKVEVREFNY